MTAVAGVDLSLTGTGIAIINGSGEIHTHLVKSTGKKDASLADRRERLGRVRGAVIHKVGTMAQRPELVVIEAPSYGSSGGQAHERAGLWWMVVSALMEWGYPVVSVAPTTLKKYVASRGNVDKDEMLAAAIKQYPQADITNNNVADAVGLAAMGARHLGFPALEVSFNASQDAAMKTPKWVTA